MFDNNSIEDSLWNLPSLPLLLDRIHHRLDDERLKRAEFRSWLTEDTKAEFINGGILMHSPAADDHNEAVLNLGSIANVFSNIRQLGKVRVEKALIGMTRNDYEPDIAFWRKEVADRFVSGMNVYPVPDLIVEVLSPGKENIKRDTETKYEDYAAHGVREYWIVDPKKQTVEQYLLSETAPEKYELHKKAILTDNIESKVLEGFAIPVKAIFDAKTNADAIQQLVKGKI
jgi:Uma2 family endonuclease